MTNDIEEIEARAEKASKAPIVAKVWSMPERIDGHFFRGPVVSEEEAEADAQFYAHARSDVPALLAEVRSLRAQLAAADAKVKELEKAREDAATFVEHQAYEAEKETGLLRAELAAKDAALVASAVSVERLGHAHGCRYVKAESDAGKGRGSYPDEDRCDCGLYAALSTITAALKGEKP